MLSVNVHAQIPQHELSQILEEGTQITAEVAMQIARKAADLSALKHVSLATAWSVMYPDLKQWLPTPQHALIVAFVDETEVYGAQVLIAGHPMLDMQMVLAAVEVIPRYNADPHCEMNYRIVELAA